MSPRRRRPRPRHSPASARGRARLHWRRAKDPTKLYEAVAAKIKAQAEYVCSRDGVVEHGFGPGRGHKEISAPKSLLPDADPGSSDAHRWRKRFCLKSETG